MTETELIVIVVVVVVVVNVVVVVLVVVAPLLIINYLPRFFVYCRNAEAVICCSFDTAPLDQISKIPSDKC